MKNAVALILGGGRGTRLAPLTSIRSKPAVPVAGKYRLIDIPISNCLNSEINKIYVLTQFLSVSLHSHIRSSYAFDKFSGGFVELLAAQETASNGTDWYQGTADAVRKNLIYFDQPDIDYVVILSGDQLYRMDYQELIQTHIDTKADVTISCMPVSREDAKGFGIMQLEDSGRVKGFVEKPQTDAEMDEVRTDPEWISSRGIDSKGRDCLASMGIYVFNKKLLIDMLTGSDFTDFGKEVFPQTIQTHNVQTHLFDGYWEDIGTIKSFYDANLNLASPDAEFDLISTDHPIYTRSRFLPPTQMSGARIKNSLIADGCRIGEGAVIENSIIGLRTIVGKNVTIKNSIIMGAADYERDDNKRIPLGIDEGTLIDGAIVDLDCRIGKNVKIIGNADQPDSDLEHSICVVRDGIPIIIKKSVLEDGWNLNDVIGPV